MVRAGEARTCCRADECLFVSKPRAIHFNCTHTHSHTSSCSVGCLGCVAGFVVACAMSRAFSVVNTMEPLIVSVGCEPCATNRSTSSHHTGHHTWCACCAHEVSPRYWAMHLLTCFAKVRPDTGT